MSKVLFIIANEGFKTVEYKKPKEYLEQQGVKVEAASDRPEGVEDEKFFATGDDGYQVKVDLDLDKVCIDDYDGIFVIGGPGALEHLDNYKTYQIIEKINAEPDKLFGAICISTRILANSGVLSGRNVTGWDGDDELKHVLDNAGAHYIKSGVVVDRNLITAVGPSQAHDFGEAIAKVLQGETYLDL